MKQIHDYDGADLDDRLGSNMSISTCKQRFAPPPPHHPLACLRCLFEMLVFREISLTHIMAYQIRAFMNPSHTYIYLVSFRFYFCFRLCPRYV